MSIVNTVQVSKVISSVLFAPDSSLNVMLVKLENSVVVAEESIKIDAIDVPAILDQPPTAGLTLRANMILNIYNYLVSSGTVPGTIV